MTSPGRIPIVGGNWKMNTTLGEAKALATELLELVTDSGRAEVVICPPFTNLQAVGQIVNGSQLQLGGQDLFWEHAGAYTGEISAGMLTSVGATWVICGHSERRHVLGESDEIVNRKARRALESGLNVILAVGETQNERDEDRTEEVLTRQLAGGLTDIADSDMERVVLAYEPVWAIGTGLTATPIQAQEAHRSIRDWLAGHCATEVADGMRIQYGGSVSASNAAEIMAMPDVDGALVGGASLKAPDFAAIVRAAGAER